MAFSAVILAVVVLQARGAVKPRPEVSSGVSNEAVGMAPAEAPLTVPVATAPVVPPPPVSASLPDAPAMPPAPRMSIRSVDLRTLPALDNLATQTGASFDPQRVTYGDLSGTSEVALVPLKADGTAGTLAVAVVGVGSDGPQVLALLSPDKSSRSQLSVTIDSGLIVMTRGVLGPEDSLCCPSQTKRGYYAWDGTRLQLQRESVTDNVSAKN